VQVNVHFEFQFNRFSFFLSTVVGPGIPPADPVTGGFKGGVRTELRTFTRPRYSGTVKEEETAIKG
jgi:hypothetical protein